MAARIANRGAEMSGGRHFPIRSFVASVVLVAVAAASVYLAYELVVKPRLALQDQIREQQGPFSSSSKRTSASKPTSRF